jgi:hypothetical protein
MPVTLLPPISSGYGMWCGEQPLTTGPRYARGRGNSRWHRVRSATLYPANPPYWPDERTVYHWWCGQSATHNGKQGPLWLADDIPAAEPACGPCVGKALGAGQDEAPAGLPKLRFDPRYQQAPALCPGSGKQQLVEPLDARYKVGRCLACGVQDSIRALGRGYSSYGYGLVKHPPGPGLMPPCPFHAWLRLTRHADGGVACGCGWPGGES